MRNLVLFAVLFMILGFAFAMPVDNLTISEKSSNSTSKQGGLIPHDPSERVVTPPARTGVTEPDASTTWRHDETGVEVKWRGLGDGLFKIELHKNGSFVVHLSSWLEGVSSFTKQPAVSSNWGSGSGFQVKLIDDLDHEYLSEDFHIKSNLDICFPNSTSCWSTGTTSTVVVWEGFQGNTVKLDIYRNGSRIGDYSGWVTNSGTFERTAPVPADWGNGTGYTIRILDNQDNEGESEQFSIGNITVSMDGNTVRWTGGLGAVKIELFDGNELVSDLSGWIDNTSSFSLQNANLPNGYTPGRGFCRVKVSDRRDSFGWADGSSLLFGGSGPVSGMEFVTVPTGSFTMGSSLSEPYRDSNDEIRHSVTVSSFELMTTEVTQGMWEDVMGSTIQDQQRIAEYDLGLPGSGSSYPMYYVSWNDCQEFIEKMNDLDPSHTYRLPTEAEWEFACRAGTTKAFYWGGSMYPRYCWYGNNAGRSTHPVGEKLSNAWGLHDMSGNVWEWCQDVYTSDYSDCPTDGRAYIDQDSDRVVRGGGWINNDWYCRSANRGCLGPDFVSNYLGLRLAR